MPARISRTQRIYRFNRTKMLSGRTLPKESRRASSPLSRARKAPSWPGAAAGSGTGTLRQRPQDAADHAGGGLRVRLFDYLNGAVDVGVPLRSGPDTASGDVFTRFRMWGEF